MDEKEALIFLNNFRGKHYNEPNGTELYNLAQAINIILSKYYNQIYLKENKELNIK